MCTARAASAGPRDPAFEGLPEALRAQREEERLELAWPEFVTQGARISRGSGAGLRVPGPRGSRRTALLVTQNGILSGERRTCRRPPKLWRAPPGAPACRVLPLLSLVPLLAAGVMLGLRMPSTLSTMWARQAGGGGWRS
jgi:hypothetical protein